ncbi:arginase family protein [Clavibacter nebraskensis]|uniref:Arginase n=3 Tax=Clavibacter nebraskensis TaxID=31963 RepID=A0AAI9EIQ2_9MICO|nr:arginase family protein [Clavibacter nebraskensis]QGV66319.1 arginase family protein [Clavibacter nebraskensis]QGV69117.1 arginase family protein [Clavibacter nebraskensis]QGV71907.1 arginase family protein [Clavibacter nebraskensis]UKF27511.1 arginase family protein [Clavibacter nebraskensis]UQB05982.1 arginase family protein [Clavibacter nebraskensis]
MPASFVVVPQWQGSGSSRAMRLADGAEAIRGDLPASATHVVDVPVEAGESLGTGVLRYASLLAVRTRQEAALEAATASGASPVVTVGGDCGVEIASIGHAAAAHPGLAVVWLDAHADLNSPASSPSGAFHGMVLRAVIGEGVDGLDLAAGTVTPDRVVLAGVRALDDTESDLVESRGIALLGADAVGPEALVAAVAATGAERVYIHVDLDVLDPGAMSGVGYPEPFGLDVQVVTESIKALRRSFELAGAGITEFAPSSPAAAVEDMGTILRIIGALTGPV